MRNVTPQMTEWACHSPHQ